MSTIIERIKVSDLSVGDWVQAETMGRLCPPMRVVSLGEGVGGWVNLVIDQEQGDPFEYEPSEIRGIEITREVLERNGWSRDVYSNSIWFYHEDYVAMTYFFEGRKLNIARGSDSISLGVLYLHELQHCLRLVGVYKEITI